MAPAPRAEGGGGRGGAASSVGQTEGEMSLQGPDGLAQTVRIAHCALLSRNRLTKLYLSSESGSFRGRGAEFVDNRIGDVGLVSRLSLAFKLESHEGCVNSLHFNSCGSR